VKQNAPTYCFVYAYIKQKNGMSIAINHGEERETP
jgi:hypothetical protein